MDRSPPSQTRLISHRVFDAATAPARRLIESHRFIDLPSSRPPWQQINLALRSGDPATSFACGRTYLSKALDIWVEPSFQLWMRIGDRGEIFRSTRASHSFVADCDGSLQLASYFPGEWSSRDGTLSTPVEDYRKVADGMSILLIRWQTGVQPQQGLEDCRTCGSSARQRFIVAVRTEPKPGLLALTEN